jgi:hypothetical protein
LLGAEAEAEAVVELDLMLGRAAVVIEAQVLTTAPRTTGRVRTAVAMLAVTEEEIEYDQTRVA